LFSFAFKSGHHSFAICCYAISVVFFSFLHCFIMSFCQWFWVLVECSLQKKRGVTLSLFIHIVLHVDLNSSSFVSHFRCRWSTSGRGFFDCFWCRCWFVSV
jgi:hypothetical protein